MKDTDEASVQERISEVVHNITLTLEHMLREVEKILWTMHETKKVSELMYNKKMVLLTMLNSMPIKSIHCFYCLYYSSCDSCTFGEHYGICSASYSYYYKMREYLNKLIHQIEKNYWGGKTFELLPDPDVDESAMKVVVNTIHEQVIQHLGRKIAQFSTAETTTPEELTKAKMRLLYGIINTLPLNSDACYYCVMNRREQRSDVWKCRPICEYGKHFGICTEEGSEYRTTMQLIRELKYSMLYEWYSFKHKGG